MIDQPEAPARQPFRVLPSHERLLLALGRYVMLTAVQARRLLFGAGSLTYVQTRLRQLADAGYVHRVLLGRPGPHGAGPFVYHLDRRGRAFLASLGLDVPRRLRQSEARGRAAPHLRHSLAVVDVQLACELVCRYDARFAIARMVGERDLRARPVAVTLPDGRRREIAPDAWVDVRVADADGIAQVCIAFEVDRGTEWQTAWRTKVRALLAADRGPYQQAFGVAVLTVAVVAPTDVRAAQLQRWTERETAAAQADAQADLFRFGTLPADLADARAFFLAPRWRAIGQTAPIPLIPVRSAAAPR